MSGKAGALVCAVMNFLAPAWSLAQSAPVDQIVRQTPACQKLLPMSIELGNATHTHYRASFGKGAPISQEPLRIASATKWISAAYFLEKVPEPLSVSASLGLRMLSGRTFFDGCDRTPTVAACFHHKQNGRANPRDIGFFSYGGGHFAGLAMDIGLGALNTKDLAREVQVVLGIPEIDFDTPNFAAGGVVTTRAYVTFLKKVLDGKLKMSRYLGADSVCTLPQECASSRGTVVPVNFSYSYGHWIERTPQATGDGVFSSVGMWGFYPWIDPRDGSYGVIAARSSNGQAYLSALECGRRIRTVHP